MDRGAAGAKGGRSTFRRYGKAYMAQIGRKGYEATLARHFQSDEAGFRRWLHGRAAEAQMDSFVTRELNRRLDNGERIASMELPIIEDPDEFADLPY